MYGIQEEPFGAALGLLIGSPIAVGAAHLVASWKESTAMEEVGAAVRALRREHTLSRWWMDDVLHFKTQQTECPVEVQQWLMKVESVHFYGETLELE